jgi:hypothetical protein
MPATSMRDLIVKDDDLVVATHGRGFWILDDITPLRQLDSKAAATAAFLFRPQDAVRVRWNMNSDTPLPPDEPGAKNPPDGAIINYTLQSAASGLVTLELLDGAGKLVRRYTSADPAEKPNPANAAVPLYWYRPPQVLQTAPGMHRFLWDMHYQPIAGGGGRGGLPIAAIAYDTANPPNAPWVLPGSYTVKLTVEGQSYTQPLTVKMDPRVKASAAVIAQQFTLSKEMYDGMVNSGAALRELRALRAQVKPLQDRAGQSTLSQLLSAFDQKAQGLEGSGGGFGGRGGGRGGGGGQDTLSGISGSLSSLMGLLEGADAAPTSQLLAAVDDARKALGSLMARWNTLKNEDLPKLNDQLKAANLPPLALAP